MTKMSVVVLNKGTDLIFPSFEFYSGWENHSKESCAKPAKMMRWDDDGAAPVHCTVCKVCKELYKAQLCAKRKKQSNTV